MRYGLCGAHRSGKTTLGQAVAEELGIEFLSNSTTQTARELGYDPVAPMPLRNRLDLQSKLLLRHVELVKNAPSPVIVDRTPLDIVAYALCEIGMQSHHFLDDDEQRRVKELITFGIEATKMLYDCVFWLEPLPVYEVDPEKPMPNLAYQAHHSTMCLGLLGSLNDQVNAAIVPATDLAARVEMVTEILIDRLDTIDEERKAAPYH